MARWFSAAVTVPHCSLLALILSFLGGCQSALPTGTVRSGEVIPIGSCYSTIANNGVHDVARAIESESAETRPRVSEAARAPLADVRLMRARTRNNGAAAAAIVRGLNLTAAVLATGQADRQPSPDSDREGLDAWLFVDLGSFDVTRRDLLRINRVMRQDTILRLEYSVPTLADYRGQSLNELSEWFVWVRFGRLTPANYTVELVCQTDGKSKSYQASLPMKGFGRSASESSYYLPGSARKSLPRKE